MYMLMNTLIYVCTQTYLLFIYQYIYLKYNLTLALKTPEVSVKAQI